MRVELECRLDAVIAETLAYGLDVDALLEVERGVRVSQAVQPDLRHIGHLPDAATEAAPDDVRILTILTIRRAGRTPGRDLSGTRRPTRGAQRAGDRGASWQSG